MIAGDRRLITDGGVSTFFPNHRRHHRSMEVVSWTGARVHHRKRRAVLTTRIRRRRGAADDGRLGVGHGQDRSGPKRDKMRMKSFSKSR